MTGPVALGLWQLAGAAVLVLLNGVLSVWLRLGLERKLLVASLRTVVQLLIVGYLLAPVFAWDHPGPVLAVCALMVVLAGRAAARRSSRSYPGMQAVAVVSMALGAGLTALLATSSIIAVTPWYRPQYLVPLLGMMLGNTLTGVSLGLDGALAGLDRGRDLVEGRLALGASWWEAARPVARDSIRTGMVPILNAMSVVGLVTLPGMMTGQILAGSDPALAARYQILIMFLIAGATAAGTTLAVLVSLRLGFDDAHRLRRGFVREG